MMGLQRDGTPQATSAHETVRDLQTPLYLAEEMGNGVGRSEILF